MIRHVFQEYKSVKVKLFKVQAMQEAHSHMMVLY